MLKDALFLFALMGSMVPATAEDGPSAASSPSPPSDARQIPSEAEEGGEETSPAAMKGCIAEDSDISDAQPLPAEEAREVPPWHWPPVPALAGKRPIISQTYGRGPDARRVRRAEQALARRDFAAATSALKDVQGAPAALVTARIALGQSDLSAARQALGRAAQAPRLEPWVRLETGRLLLAEGHAEEARQALEPVWQSGRALARQALLPLAAAWAQAAPQKLVEHAESFLSRAPKRDVHARGRLLGWLAVAQTRLGHLPAAQAALLRRFVEEAHSSETPAELPPGILMTAEHLLRRAERLIDAHRNAQAEAALGLLDTHHPVASLTVDQRCRRAFAGGLLARKQHRYRQSEALLGEVMATCQDTHQVQKAAFLAAKVISIQDGLRALGPIEAFVARYPNNSMVDDALFWAGDILQRRGRLNEAEAYYARILALTQPDDQCSEAGWRLALIALQRGDVSSARKAYQTLLRSPCPLEPGDRARAQWWLARLEAQSHHPERAKAMLKALQSQAPLTFYGQAGLRLTAQLSRPKEAAALRRQSRRPSSSKRPRGLCPMGLGQQPALADALMLLSEGLITDAARELESLPQPPLTQTDVTRCSRAQASLLVSELLSLADAPKAAQLRLKRDFATALASPPQAETLPIWEAAYPLAFRPAIRAAEHEARLPPLLLQALAREESSFDPHVLSWAEAWGLTQLMYPSAQHAAQSLGIAKSLVSPEQLTDPALNARLGAALLRFNLDRLHDEVAPALAAYNGGLTFARQWSERLAHEDVLLAIEKIAIGETRGYVKRVSETWGIYRWLYGGSAAELALPDTMYADPPPNKLPKRPRASRGRH